MAIYHLHCDIIGRGGGRSAVAAAAYRSCSKIYDETTGEEFDFRRKEKALYTEMLFPDNHPNFVYNRSEFWNEVQKKESRTNSRFCRSFDIALPSELDLSDNIEIIKRWIKNNYTSRGLVADLCIHSEHKDKKTGQGNKNIHAHILVSTRAVDSNGWTEKDREVNSTNYLKIVRKSWADICNFKFAEMDIAERIDERTLAEQGIDREPQQHLGAVVTAMQRKGKKTRRKKYKSQEEEALLIPEPTETEIQNALAEDCEFLNLVAEKIKLKNQKNEETEIQNRFEVAKDFIQNSDNFEQTKKNVIKQYRVEQCYHFVRQNKKDELNYWRELNNKTKFEQVKKIADYPKFDKVIFPTVQNYYQELKYPAYNKNGHWDKFCNWIKTTDFLPVKICRNVIEKIKSLGGGIGDRADGKKKIKTR
jgi:hypothetical protein